MLKIKIANHVFEYLEAVEAEEHYNGSYRRTLAVTCEPYVMSVDELNTMLTEANLATITMENTHNGVVNVYDGYVLKLACGIHNKEIAKETGDAPAVYADRLVFKLGKRTYIEEQLHKLGVM